MHQVPGDEGHKEAHKQEAFADITLITDLESDKEAHVLSDALANGSAKCDKEAHVHQVGPQLHQDPGDESHKEAHEQEDNITSFEDGGLLDEYAVKNDITLVSYPGSDKEAHVPSVAPANGCAKSDKEAHVQQIGPHLHQDPSDEGHKEAHEQVILPPDNKPKVKEKKTQKMKMLPFLRRGSKQLSIPS